MAVTPEEIIDTAPVFYEKDEHDEEFSDYLGMKTITQWASGNKLPDVFLGLHYNIPQMDELEKLITQGILVPADSDKYYYNFPVEDKEIKTEVFIYFAEDTLTDITLRIKDFEEPYEELERAILKELVKEHIIEKKGNKRGSLSALKTKEGKYEWWLVCGTVEIHIKGVENEIVVDYMNWEFLVHPDQWF